MSRSPCLEGQIFAMPMIFSSHSFQPLPRGALCFPSPSIFFVRSLTNDFFIWKKAGPWKKSFLQFGDIHQFQGGMRGSQTFYYEWTMEDYRLHVVRRPNIYTFPWNSGYGGRWILIKTNVIFVSFFSKLQIPCCCRKKAPRFFPVTFLGV